MKARIIVRPRDGVLDPQGQAIVHALGELGYGSVAGIRVGKSFDVVLDTEDPEEGRRILDEISEKLLANLVIEDYEVLEGDG